MKAKNKRIGILGGGQLGRMFLQAAYNFPFEYHVLDKKGAPCQAICTHFHEGDFNQAEDILAFAKDLDVISIEIEHVNTRALAQLEALGKTVIPASKTLATIKDKGLQKQHYQAHNIPSPDFYLIENKDEIDLNRLPLPFVQKQRTGGYDGKGVQIIRDANALAKVWDTPSVIEQLTDIDKEIAVLVAKSQSGELCAYPAVEMVFDEKLNLVNSLISPALISQEQQQAAKALALLVAQSFDGAGLFAVEMFIDKQQQLWVNETAPRVHNSGHHTIEAAPCSQFEQMLRILADLPLGDSQQAHYAGMVNLLGADKQTGTAYIAGIKQLTAMPSAHLHWYGKSNTSPGRKMGHVTVIDDDISRLQQTLATIEQQVSVMAEDFDPSH